MSNSEPIKDFITDYYEYDPTEFEPQVTIVHLSFSDLCLLLHTWEAYKENKSINQ